MTTKFSGSLRLVMAAAVMLAVIVPGFLNRSAWIILLATPAYTALYALGKWNAWKLAWQMGGAKAVLPAIATTLPVQLVVVAVFYLIGLGLSMLVGMSDGIKALTSLDVVVAVGLFLFAVALSSVINVIEAKAGGEAPAAAASALILEGEGSFVPLEEPELDIDPVPLTPQSFYISRGYWKHDALYDALEKRSESVVKVPEAATEAMITATETRLGVRLPETLRSLYKVMDGGYVGDLYVPLKTNPGPVFDDWRGAFAIDYSSLDSLNRLKTVKEHYEDFTDDPDEMPKNADKMVVLQKRYLDTTLLDYSEGAEPKIRLVDFDDYADDLTNVEFPDFDSFFAALRRPKKEKRRSGDQLLTSRTRPIGEMMPAQQPSEFWGSDVHVFYNIAKSKKDGSEPKKQADDELVAATEARLGVTLPPLLVDFWRYRNGGALAASYFQTSGADEAYGEIGLPDQLMPMEYFAMLADVSDRIVFPEGERSLRDRHPGADRLLVLQAKGKEALLLDYRGNTLEPGVLIVDDLEGKHLASARRINSFALLVDRLRAWKAIR